MRRNYVLDSPLDIKHIKHMAKIGIVATALSPGRTGGAETYIRKLLGCPEYQEALQKHEVMLFAGTPCDAALKACPFQIIECNIDSRNRTKRILWEQFFLPGILKNHKLDLVHFPYSTNCLGYTDPAVITIHDTTNFIMPKSVCLSEKIYRRILQSGIVSNTDNHVIAVSETDKTILQKYLKLPASRMSVAYHGAPEDFFLPQEPTTPRKSGYMLWIGRPYYHKNIEFLVVVQKHLRDLLKQTTPVLRLIGLDKDNQTRIKKIAEQYKVADLVETVPPMPHNQLVPVMQKARLFVFPSLYESFGIPPIEAMQSGTPVVCSDLPILKEILGDAALYANPKDPIAFAQDCAALLQDDQKWTQYVQRGYAQAKRYTWKHCALDTVNIYEKLLNP